MNWLDDLKQHVNFRLSNPFLPAFAVSWLIWNYQVLLFLVSDYAAVSKIYQIESFYSPEGGWASGWGVGVLYPAISAALLLLVAPIPGGIASVYLAWQTRMWKRLLICAEGGIPVRREELEECKKAHKERMEQVRLEVVDLEQQVQSLRSQREDLADQLRKSKEQLLKVLEERDEKEKKEVAEAVGKARITCDREVERLQMIIKKRGDLINECLDAMPDDVKSRLNERSLYVELASDLGFPMKFEP
jgi:hypothetical protein